MARSKDKSRDEKSTDGQEVLPLPDMTVSPLELSYLNDHLEDHEGDGHVNIPEDYSNPNWQHDSQNSILGSQ